MRLPTLPIVCVMAAVALPGAALAQSRPGVSAELAAAGKAGDADKIAALTGGRIIMLKPGTGEPEFERITPQQLVAMVRGCRPYMVEEPVPNPPADQSYKADGSIGWACDGKPVEGKPCEDVGYGVFVKPRGDVHALVVSRSDNEASERCGALLADANLLFWDFLGAQMRGGAASVENRIAGPVKTSAAGEKRFGSKELTARAFAGAVGRCAVSNMDFNGSRHPGYTVTWRCGSVRAFGAKLDPAGSKVAISEFGPIYFTPAPPPPPPSRAKSN